MHTRCPSSSYRPINLQRAASGIGPLGCVILGVPDQRMEEGRRGGLQLWIMDAAGGLGRTRKGGQALEMVIKQVDRIRLVILGEF